MGSVIENYKHFADWEEYELGCPEGTWTARLDHKAWGKSRNLILYVTDQATGAKFWLSVFSHNDYKPRDNGHDFRNVAEPGDMFEFTTSKTKGGYPNLQSARKLLAAVQPIAAAQPSDNAVTPDDNRPPDFTIRHVPGGRELVDCTGYAISLSDGVTDDDMIEIQDSLISMFQEGKREGQTKVAVDVLTGFERAILQNPHASAAVILEAISLAVFCGRAPLEIITRLRKRLTGQ